MGKDRTAELVAQLDQERFKKMEELERSTQKDEEKKAGEELVSQLNKEIHMTGWYESDDGTICLLYTSPSPRD